jgi:hypothetical protein
MNQPLVEVALTQADTDEILSFCDRDVVERYALDPLEAVPADRIAIEEFQAKRRPQIITSAQDLKQKHAARRVRQRAAKLPTPE